MYFLLAGDAERFFAPIILLLVDMFSGTITTISDFLSSFRFHFLSFGFPLASLYGLPSRMLA